MNQHINEAAINMYRTICVPYTQGLRCFFTTFFFRCERRSGVMRERNQVRIRLCKAESRARGEGQNMVICHARVIECTIRRGKTTSIVNVPIIVSTVMSGGGENVHLN